MASHLALAYDPAARRADLAFAGGGLVLDATPATPAIAALLSDRRARADDALPLPAAPTLAPDILNPRRGWAGDALDAGGRRCGSRLWLLQRARETEATRARAERYAREALVPVAGAQALDVSAEWVRKGVLVYTARIGADVITVEQAIT